MTRTPEAERSSGPHVPPPRRTRRWPRRKLEQVGPRGGKGHEVTATKGETLPPTTSPGSTYKLVDATKNKSGR